MGGGLNSITPEKGWLVGGGLTTRILFLVSKKRSKEIDRAKRTVVQLDKKGRWGNRGIIIGVKGIVMVF